MESLFEEDVDGGGVAEEGGVVVAPGGIVVGLEAEVMAMVSMLGWGDLDGGFVNA